MLGQMPRNVVTMQPLGDGVIANFERAELMLNHLCVR